jgi:hypothetical protein
MYEERFSSSRYIRGLIVLVEIIDAPQITDNFILKLYKRTKSSRPSRQLRKEEFNEWKAKVKSKIMDLLGELPESAPLDPCLLSVEETEKFLREKWLIRSEEDSYVPLYLLIPKNRGVKENSDPMCTWTWPVWE